jgi:hypothetical protein
MTHVTAMTTASSTLETPRLDENGDAEEVWELESQRPLTS